MEGNPIPGCGSNLIVRAALLQAIGGFDEQFFHLADWDMSIRLARAGRGVAITELLVGYVQHASNRHLGGPQPELEAFRLAQKHGATREQAKRMVVVTARWKAYGYRRCGYRLRAARTYAASALREGSIGQVPRAVRALLGERKLSPRREYEAGSLHWLEAFTLPSRHREGE
jgi:hypothetical protein